MKIPKKRIHHPPPLATVKVETLDELEAMTFAAMVMAAVDEYIDVEEMSLINEFVQYHWHPSFGDVSYFMLEVDRKLADFLFPEGNDLDFKIYQEKFFKELLPRLNHQHQRDLFTLMQLVMDVDGIQEPSEISLLKTLSDHLG